MQSRVLVLCASVAIAGCGGTTSTTNDLAPPVDLRVAAAVDMTGGGPTQVMVGANGSFTFSPKDVTIKVGDTVEWVWASSSHSVVSGSNATADDKFCSPSDSACATTPTSATGATYTHKFMAAGTFPYFCMPHAGAGMTGTVTVQ